MEPDPVGIIGKESIYRKSCILTHAGQRVKDRCDLKGQGIMCVYFFDIQERKQYSEEKTVAGFNSLEPILQERSVLPCQRNNVSNGRQSDQV